MGIESAIEIETVKFGKQVGIQRDVGQDNELKIPKNGFGPIRKYLNWSYRANKHLRTFLLTGFASRMSPNVFEKNEGKINENKCCWWILGKVFLYRPRR